MTNVYADYAPLYVEAGFRVFPTGGDDGKMRWSYIVGQFGSQVKVYSDY
jgi:hypothetical protein